MGETTAIEWTQATWNPWVGCQKVSQGCKHCYMFRDAERFGKDPSEIRQTAAATFNAPLKWKEPKRIFTCSWSDFFIAAADEWRAEAWDVIRRTPQHTYQILTKRPERILEHLPADWGRGYPNVWLGVTVENQKAADERIIHLMQTPAAVRFLSCEPLLGPVDLEPYFDPTGSYCCGGEPEYCTCLHGWQRDDDFRYVRPDWVIAGGESGPDARPMHPEWTRTLRDQCQAAGVAYFFKQWGEWAARTPGDVFGPFDPLAKHNNRDRLIDVHGLPNCTKEAAGEGYACMSWVGKKAAGRELDGRTWDQFPEVR